MVCVLYPYALSECTVEEADMAKCVRGRGAQWVGLPGAWYHDNDIVGLGGPGLIISASRRTDIPAFYGEWFMNRIRAGFCLVPNPYCPTKVSMVSLAKDDVDAIVFWSRDPRSMMPHLHELDNMGYGYLFQYTINGYPRLLEPKMPDLGSAIATFVELASVIGPSRTLWRYDPIILSNITPPEYHIKMFSEIAAALEGSTTRVTVSLLDLYRKTKRRLEELEEISLWETEVPGAPGQLKSDVLGLFAKIAAIARSHGMVITSCAEPYDLSACGIGHGACIDADTIRAALGVEVSRRKDPGQRGECGCVVSRDIGVYDTCMRGCVYCYATDGTGTEKAHDPHAPALNGGVSCTRQARLSG